MLGIIVSIATWLTPMPAHAQGLLVVYGSQQLVEANAAFHGYDLSPYRDRCGLSAISPADLGRVMWIRTGGDWYGPCLAVDVAAIRDFYNVVYVNGEIAEIGRLQSDLFGFRYSAFGEVAVSLCPPALSSAPQWYSPPLREAAPGQIEPSMWPYPPQEFPTDCS